MTITCECLEESLDIGQFLILGLNNDVQLLMPVFKIVVFISEIVNVEAVFCKLFLHSNLGVDEWFCSQDQQRRRTLVSMLSYHR